MCPTSVLRFDVKVRYLNSSWKTVFVKRAFDPLIHTRTNTHDVRMCDLEIPEPTMILVTLVMSVVSVLITFFDLQRKYAYELPSVQVIYILFQ